MKPLTKAITVLTLVMAGIFLAILLVVRGALFPYTDPFSDEDDTIPEKAVAVLEVVELGGMKQYLLMRGTDRSNPVLLWLHGGPGAAQMPLAHYLDGKLEKEFVVVHWDQRGAGKSNHGGFDLQSMTFDRFINDARELTDYLRERFNQEKIYLLGHSWGSQLGIELVSRYPEDYTAYISVSQVVDNHRSYETGYSWLKEQLRENQKTRDLQRLEDLGTPPFTEHHKHVAFAQLVGKYGGNFDIGMGRLAQIAIRAPEYSLADYYRWLNGANRGSGPMWNEIYAHRIDYISKIPSLDLPVFFLTGLNDFNTPHQLIDNYYQKIVAPKKELIVFEQSAHTPFLGEPEKFSSELIRIKQLLNE